MEERTGKNGRKTSVIFSIASEVMLLVVIVVVLAIVGFVTNAVPKAESALADTNKEYIMSMAELSAELIDKTIGTSEGTTEQYASVLGDIKMEGVSSSYAYFVDSDGTMLYHPSAEKIGSPVENAVVTSLVAELEAGKVPADDVVTYNFNGSVKYAAYALTEQNKIVVVTADEDDVLQPMNKMLKSVAVTCVTCLMICLVIGFFMSRLIIRPIRQLTEIIDTIAVLDFRPNKNGQKLCTRKDETGAMARAVRSMRENLSDMVNRIENTSVKISDTVAGLQDVTNTVDSMCTDNSATSQELAAGMQETAATTETINGNIGQIKVGADEIGQLTISGAKTSEEVMQRAQRLRNTTIDASTKTREIYDSVKAKADDAIEESKAVHKINELTETIMAISSQTSLLALNASIEAARAGEAGRGFAVVATEIGNLANETSRAIADINNIVDEVNLAVAKMSDCLGETTDFLENTVLTDYKEFEKVGEQYREDADVFKNSMNSVEEAMSYLTESIDSIAEALSGISSTIGESTSGVTDIAEKTSGMVEKTSTAFEMVSKCNECSDELRGIVNKFIME